MIIIYHRILNKKPIFIYHTLIYPLNHFRGYKHFEKYDIHTILYVPGTYEYFTEILITKHSHLFEF